MRSPYLFTLILTFFVYSPAFSQSTFKADSFTMYQLKEILENAYVEILEEKEYFLKVKDRLTFFIDLDLKQHRYVQFNMNFSCADKVNKNDVLDYVNRVNSELILIRAYYNEKSNRVYFNYYFWIEKSEFSAKHLIRSLKIFDSALSSAYQKDTKSVLK